MTILLKALSTFLAAQGIKNRFVKWLDISRRIILIGLLLYLAVNFVLTNPFVNFAILILVVAISYDSIRNMVIGIFLDQEFDLTPGRTYLIGNYRGILDKKGLTGLRLSSQGNISFISYRMAFDKGIQTEQSKTSANVALELYSEDSDISITEDKIRSLLFPLPYILDNNIPRITIKDGKTVLEVGLMKESYTKSLRDLLENHSIKSKPLSI